MGSRQEIAAAAQAALARRIAGLSSPRWTPLPHQIPPEGRWPGWLLLAGRMAGKTDACANAMIEHVNGPPCLAGPIPHWMAIIGPTLGDASRACYEGPSGIRAHDPTAQKVTRDGGTVVHWPNGSEAKLFGAHTEEDTNRLRAGGNTCAAARTLVETEDGPRPIESVRAGERVWTRNGLRRVLRVWDNGVKQVRRYDHAAGSVWLTPDHHVWTVDGWKDASEVSPGDTVFTRVDSGSAQVAAGALRSSRRERSARVYDLTVEHDHEFFADGLLVSNCFVWGDEIAAWVWLDEAWAQMRFGLRMGPNPKWVASTTPRPRPLIKRLLDMDFGNRVTRASYLDNPHIVPEVKQALEDTYAGTQLGRQELYGELIEQDENALWTHERIDAARVAFADLPPLARKTVGVDPSGGAGEQGIVVSAKAMLPRSDTDRRLVSHGFVLADRTVHLSPDGWGRRAVQAAVDYEADDIVVERNYGGDMAQSTIRSAADAMGISIPIRVVTASQGKRVRAAPVAALTEQLRWHHAGVFPELENQLCTWYAELKWSPDRLDGMVWGAHHNKVVRPWTSMGGVQGNGKGSSSNSSIVVG